MAEGTGWRRGGGYTRDKTTPREGGRVHVLIFNFAGMKFSGRSPPLVSSMAGDFFFFFL